MLGSLRLTVQESIRYRGRSGHYSWLAHRLSGLAILGFLVLHVWDTSFAHYFPNLYEWTVSLYKTPLFGAGEILVAGAVLYHALNGIRVTLLDFKPEWWHYQARSATLVWAIFAVLFVPAAIYLTSLIVGHCQHAPVWPNGVAANSCWSIPPLSAFGIGN